MSVTCTVTHVDSHLAADDRYPAVVEAEKSLVGWCVLPDRLHVAQDVLGDVVAQPQDGELFVEPGAHGLRVLFRSAIERDFCCLEQGAEATSLLAMRASISSRCFLTLLRGPRDYRPLPLPGGSSTPRSP